MKFFLLYNPTINDWLMLGGGVFVVLLVAYMVTKYTKYGGGSNYGMTGDFKDDFDNFKDDKD